MFEHIYSHLRDNSILTAYQFGFTPSNSTINQLTYMYDPFFNACHSGKEFRAVFCDINRAFDRVMFTLINRSRAESISFWKKI